MPVRTLITICYTFDERNPLYFVDRLGLYSGQHMTATVRGGTVKASAARRVTATAPMDP